MSIVLEPPHTPHRPIPASQRLLTAADLAALPDNLPSGDIKYELLEGVLITMAPPGGNHAFGQCEVIHLLRLAQILGLGRAGGEANIVLERDPDTIVAPDALFILKESLPPEYSKEGYFLTIPEIVVEVRSKNDSKREMKNKAELYLEAGVEVVWLIDPMAKTCSLMYKDGTVEVFRPEDTLTCKILPGYSTPIKDLFNYD